MHKYFFQLLTEIYPMRNSDDAFFKKVYFSLICISGKKYVLTYIFLFVHMYIIQPYLYVHKLIAMHGCKYTHTYVAIHSHT